MNDINTFSTWLTSATRSAILVVRAKVYQVLFPTVFRWKPALFSLMTAPVKLLEGGAK